MGRLEIRRVENDTATATGLAELLAQYLKDHKVLWLISGGSSIPIAAITLTMINESLKRNLFVTLVDDKYGIPAKETNWDNLLVSGFDLPHNQMARIVQGSGTRGESSLKFRDLIVEKLHWADVTIGQFGIGEGYHTGGILASSPATKTNELVCDYEEKGNDHITITPSLIMELDIAFINSLGEAKRPLIKHFLKSTASVISEPTQSLKLAKMTLLYTDNAD